MRFAKLTYRIAAIYGFIVLLPMYFFLDRFGHDAPPPVTHAEFYYGFAGLALLFQVVFLIIASDPLRYRPIMLVTVLEKVVFTIPCLILFAKGQLAKNALTLPLIDPVLGFFFVIAYVKTKPAFTAFAAQGSSSR